MQSRYHIGSINYVCQEMERRMILDVSDKLFHGFLTLNYFKTARDALDLIIDRIQNMLN